MTVSDATRIYTDMTTNIARLEQKVLQLMRHPDATHEQVVMVKEKYTAMWASCEAIKNKLCAKYPNRSTFRTYPWLKK